MDLMNGHIDVTKKSEECALSSTQGPIELFHIGYLWRKIFYLVTASFGKKRCLPLNQVRIWILKEFRIYFDG
jgi:hypothetical protein